MRRLTFILAALFFGGSFAHGADLETVEETADSELDDGAPERTQLDRWKKFAKRDAKGLHLKLRNRKEVLVRNVEDDGEASTHYEFEGYDPDTGFYLISVSYSEGNDYLLVSSKDGSQFHIPGPPIMSPDKKWLVSIMLDLDVQYNLNVIEVSRIVGGKIDNYRRVEPRQTSVNIEPEEWGPSSAVWIDSGTIRVERSVLRRIEHDNVLAPIDPLIFRLEADKWKIYVGSGATTGKEMVLVPFD